MLVCDIEWFTRTTDNGNKKCDLVFLTDEVGLCGVGKRKSGRAGRFSQ